MRSMSPIRPRAGIVLIAVLALTVLFVPAGARAAALDGKEVFLGQKCNLCHSVEAAGIEAKTKSEKLRGADLTGVTERHEPAWIAQYLKREVTMHDEEHKREWTGTDEELQALIDWLGKQKAANGGGAGASGQR